MPHQSEMTHMTNRKIICIVLALVFGLSLSASGASGRIPCDKGLCRHHTMKGLEYKKDNVNFVPMGCCTEAQKEKDPCEFEGSQPLVIQDYALSTARLHKDAPSDALVIGSNVMSNSLTLGVFGPHPKAGSKVLSSSIYIRNVTLIC